MFLFFENWPFKKKIRHLDFFIIQWYTSQMVEKFLVFVYLDFGSKVL